MVTPRNYTDSPTCVVLNDAIQRLFMFMRPLHNAALRIMGLLGMLQGKAASCDARVETR